MSILRPYPPLANNCSLQSTTPETKKRLALAIIDFLSTSLKDGTVTSEDAESIEIAQTCIADIFHVDPKDKAAIQDAIGGQSLLSIYGVYEKFKSKPSSTSPAPKPAAETAPTPASPEAESLKSQGNAAMQRKDYETAIDLYSQAIEISPLNPIYLSNRAAAYSASGMHAEAQEDAETAVAADPHYTKAWSRLGLARFVLGDAKGSMEAYEKGIEYEGNGGSEAMKKGYKTAREKVEEEEKNQAVEDQAAGSARNGPGGGAAGGMPDLSALAGLMGGGAGGGGTPDLGSIMNNPMFASMARNVMSNPDAMNNIMNNPQIRQMAEQFGLGGAGGGAGGRAGGAGSGAGGMPDLASMMNDPAIAEMARNFMGGGGRGAGSGA